MTNPLHPIAEPFEPETAALLAHYPRQDGYLLTLFRTFANSPRFLRKGVSNLLDKESPLPLRVRELVILRVTALFGCEYEWGVHAAVFARAAGIDAGQLAAITGRPLGESDWAAEEAALLAAVDQLVATGRLDEDALARFAADWTAAQQLEIIALVGNYHKVSMVANVAQLAPEPFAERFPT
jgi:alkylhydroperoxidase family enzyme